MGNGVHVAHIGTGEGQARVGGGECHFFACSDVFAIGVAGAQIAKDQAHCSQRHAIGVRRGPVADERFHGMGERINAGSRCDVGRQAGHERGVERCHFGHEAWIDDDHFVLFGGI